MTHAPLGAIAFLLLTACHPAPAPSAQHRTPIATAPAPVASTPPAPSSNVSPPAPSPPADAPRCDVPLVEPLPAGSDRGTRWGSPVALEKDKVAPIAKLRQWLGSRFDVTADGSRIVFKAPDVIVASPDGLTLAFVDEGRLHVLNAKSGARWSTQPWLASWHSNVGDAPGSFTVEFPGGGDAMLVGCEANAGMIAMQSVRLVDRATGHVRAETPEHLQMDASHGFSPEGTTLAVAYRKDLDSAPVLQIFDVASGRRMTSALVGPVTWKGEAELVKSVTPCAPALPAR